MAALCVVRLDAGMLPPPPLHAARVNAPMMIAAAARLREENIREKPPYVVSKSATKQDGIEALPCVANAGLIASRARWR